MLLKLPPDNRLRTPPVTPWAISLLKPAFIGCNTLALNPAVNAPNIPCQALAAKPTHGHKGHKMLSLLMWLAGLPLSWVAVSLLMAGCINI
jgi:capsular polysaccharide biosynthesis protein